ncbi:hypothetical protein CFC21_049568, partial [Triticum aestivum]
LHASSASSSRLVSRFKTQKGGR